MPDVHEILKRWESAELVRSANATIWRDIAAYVHPLKRDISIDTVHTGILQISSLARLFDTSGIEANMTYAAGCMSWMTPSETTWFAYSAPEYLSSDDTVKAWYSRCSDITARILAGSNFYSQIHECYLDDGAFGTAGMLILEDTRDGVRFEALPVGDYSIQEDHYREVDTLFCMHRLSPRQSVQKFGAEALPTTVLAHHADPVKCDAPQDYIHCLMPRNDYDRSRIDSKNMPFASVWIHRDSKEVVRESGFLESPFAIHRHAIWTRSPYGLSPGMRALYDLRQLSLMQQYLDTLVEKQVTPPVIAPAKYEGTIDLRGGGVTYRDNQGAAPEFWQNPGNYMVGEDRTEFRRRQIHNAFHVDLFQTLASVPIGKEMTAAEVMLRQRDRLTLFSPTFARKNTELNTPIMRRIFAILLRAGAFPPPPGKLVQQTEEGIPFVPDPEIVYTSRLALQMRAIQNEAVQRTLGQVAPLVEIDPSVIDHFNLDELVRGVARNEGLPEQFLRAKDEVDQMRVSRQQAEMQAQAEASMLEEADSVAKLRAAGVA